jgi:hypothetical protein
MKTDRSPSPIRMLQTIVTGTNSRQRKTVRFGRQRLHNDAAARKGKSTENAT